MSMSKVCCLSVNFCGNLLFEGLCDTIDKMTVFNRLLHGATKLTSEAMKCITQYLMENEHTSYVVE